MWGASLSSAPSPSFVICGLSDDGCSEQCEEIPHCSLDLHFSNSQCYFILLLKLSTLWPLGTPAIGSWASVTPRHCVVCIWVYVLSTSLLSVTSGCSRFILYSSYPSLAAAAAAKSLQSCLTLCDPRDSRPPGSPVPGILQARTLEWVAISFSSA